MAAAAERTWMNIISKEKLSWTGLHYSTQECQSLRRGCRVCWVPVCSAFSVLPWRGWRLMASAPPAGVSHAWCEWWSDRWEATGRKRPHAGSSCLLWPSPPAQARSQVIVAFWILKYVENAMLMVCFW